MHNKILSLGYQGKSIEDLIEILTKYNVEKLLDIRIKPVSRKKDFNKNRLSSKLNDVGIDYVHFRDAGNPYYKEAKNTAECLNLYSSYLDIHPEVVDQLLEEVYNGTIAILCYEKNHDVCHRSILLDMTLNESDKTKIIKIE